MNLLFLLLILCIAAVIVLISLFAPHQLPWYRPHLMLSQGEIIPIKPVPAARKQPMVMEGLVGVESNEEDNISLRDKAGRLESILLEKNVTIEKLQKQLLAEKSHREEFEKIRALLDEEITKLRAQNKKLKLKIGE